MLSTLFASLFKGSYNVEVVIGENEPSEAALRRFRKGVLNSGVLPEVRPGLRTRRLPPERTRPTCQRRLRRFPTARAARSAAGRRASADFRF